MTSTNSIEPIFRGTWLEPGMHLNSILTHEVDDECFDRSDVTVLSLREGRANEGINYAPRTLQQDIHLEIFSRAIDWGRYPELGEVLIGTAQGRTSAEQTTFFLSNVGFGAQFGALGGKVYQLACEQGVGREFDISDWYEPVR